MSIRLKAETKSIHVKYHSSLDKVVTNYSRCQILLIYSNKLFINRLILGVGDLLI